MTLCIITIPVDTDRPLKIEDVAGQDMLEVLSERVGGSIKPLALPGNTPLSDHTLYLNEERKLAGLRPNIRAMLIARCSPGQDVLVGNAVIAGPVDEEGEHLNLTADAVRYVAQFGRKREV